MYIFLINDPPGIHAEQNQLSDLIWSSGSGQPQAWVRASLCGVGVEPALAWVRASSALISLEILRADLPSLYISQRASAVLASSRVLLSLGWGQPGEQHLATGGFESIKNATKDQ